MKRLIANLTAYHLSSNSFDKFDLSKAGEGGNGGVGQCIYGYGMYFANTKDEALGFKNQIDNAKYLYTVSINGSLKDFIDWSGNNSHLKEKCELLLKNKIKDIVINELEKCTSRTGLNNVLCRYNLDKYTLESQEIDEYELVQSYCKAKNIDINSLPLDELDRILDKITLDDEWGKKLQEQEDVDKLSPEEKESVINDVKKETKIDFDIEDIINFDDNIYKEVCSLFNKDQQTTSKMFNSVGIIGVKANDYLVVFNMDNVTIVNKEDI